MDRLRIIIVTHNNEATIRDCLSAAVATAEGVPCGITVVDNASSDATVKAVGDDFPQAEVVPLETNIGFGAANNMVLRRCEAPFVLLLNPDTVIDGDAVTVLMETLRQNEDAALVGPLMEYADGSPQVSFGPFPGLLRDLRQRRLVLGSRKRNSGAVRRLGRMLASQFSPDWVSGSCFLARTGALRQVGFFDTFFFLYLEDVDLCRRLRSRGWRVLVQPLTRCVHLEGISLPDPAAARRHFHRSRLLYENKHGSRWGFRLYKLLRARGIDMSYDPEKRWVCESGDGEE